MAAARSNRPAPAKPASRRRTSSSRRKPPSRWRTVRRVGFSALALIIVVPILGFMVAYVATDVPRPGDLKTNQVATIVADDGTTEIAKIIPPEGNRTEVELADVPESVRNAVLAAEDREFYSNPGFSVTGFARAARDNLLGRESAGGGSTITQQYVKNVMVGDDHTITRKLKELVISAKMAREWDKNEILAAYLNTIYFGRGAYGIAAASTAYFDKPVNELTAAEGAVLAASIQQPTALDPETNPTGAQDRWNYVLDGMVSAGWLDSATSTAMVYPPVRSLADVDASRSSSAGPEGLIKNKVIAELEASGISETQLNTEGLQITTTIDARAQQAAVDGAHRALTNQPDNLRTAVVSIDPHSGAVRAYYGGEQGTGYDFANAGLQTGSSFKVFGLAAALQQGKGLSTVYDSSPLTVNGIRITNVEGESCGMCTIAEALKRSLNTSFYRLQLDLDGKAQAIADIAHAAGIPEDIPGVGPSLTEPDGAGPNYGIVLGQYQSRPIDMASAYATFAASGVYHQPYFVQKVVNADGDVLLDRAPDQGERRMSADVADNVSSAMAPIAAYSNGHSLAGGRPSAAKTGTAQLGDTGANKDAWMVGYTPSLSTAVWMGTPDGDALRTRGGGQIYGSGLPSDIWKATMDGALQGTPVEQFPKPGRIGGSAGLPTAVQTTQETTAAPEPEAPVVPTTVAPPQLQITQNQVEILPGITIPLPGIAPRQPEPVAPAPAPGGGGAAPEPVG